MLSSREIVLELNMRLDVLFRIDLQCVTKMKLEYLQQLEATYFNSIALSLLYTTEEQTFGTQNIRVKFLFAH